MMKVPSGTEIRYTARSISRKNWKWCPSGCGIKCAYIGSLLKKGHKYNGKRISIWQCSECKELFYADQVHEKYEKLRIEDIFGDK